MRRILVSFLIILPSLLISHELKGVASWYGGKYIGRQTANGEIFDTNQLTAAHKTLPFNTIVEVKNVETGKKVQVRINDRGPFIKGRIIDLSKEGAKKIGMLDSGTAEVTLKIISMPEAPSISDIQVGAFGSFSNVKRFKKKLVDAGFNPSTQMTNSGIIRVVLKGIPINETFTTVQKLQSIGVEKVVVMQRS